MARIRTIKPEFWTDRRVGECSTNARLLFVAAFNFADDEGGLDRSAKQLKAQAFPYDSIDCEPLVQELIEVGLVIEYEVGGDKYLHIKNFRKHQRIDKPQPARIPIYNHSENSPGVREEQAEIVHGSKGREGKGKEKEDGAAAPVLNSPPAELPEGLNLEAWSQWQAYRKLKPKSIAAAQRKLAKFGPTQSEVVEHSIAGGYDGLFAPPKSAVLAQASTADKDRRAAAEARAMADLTTRAERIGHRKPFDGEDLIGYRTLVERAESNLPRRASS